MNLISYKKVAVISDIHGNHDALQDVLKQVSTEHVELTVFLGDILTYGCQPNEVLDTLVEYQNNNHCIFIKGNHDQFYFDLTEGRKILSYKLPDFVEESIFWTQRKIGDTNIHSMFSWVESYRLGVTYFSHANPYSYGNWEYVESAEQCHKASKALNDMGCMVGVFGHSHRSKLAKISCANEISRVDSSILKLDESSTYLLNPGAIGQPRGCGLSYMILNFDNDTIRVKLNYIETDLNHSMALISETDMTQFTKERLINYLRRPT